jgi:hypothetical protein
LLSYQWMALGDKTKKSLAGHVYASSRCSCACHALVP